MISRAVKKFRSQLRRMSDSELYMVLENIKTAIQMPDVTTTQLYCLRAMCMATLDEKTVRANMPCIGEVDLNGSMATSMYMWKGE